MLKQVAGILIMIGAINWGLVGAFDINIVSALLGVGSMLEKIVYILIGASGLLMAYDMYVKPKK